MSDDALVAAIRVCVGLCRTEKALVEWFDDHRPKLADEPPETKSAAWNEVKRRTRELRSKT